MDLGGGWLKCRSLSRPIPDVIVLNGNSERFCIQCGQDYGLAFFYSNGRGGKRPRCKGCMMTRRHNLKRARLGLPPYPEAAPYVPLRTKRERAGPLLGAADTQIQTAKMPERWERAGQAFVGEK